VAKILVVDDEKRMVDLLVGSLTHKGHEVTGVTQGQQALDAARSQHYDALLTDLKMESLMYHTPREAKDNRW